MTAVIILLIIAAVLYYVFIFRVIAHKNNKL